MIWHYCCNWSTFISRLVSIQIWHHWIISHSSTGSFWIFHSVAHINIIDDENNDARLELDVMLNACQAANFTRPEFFYPAIFHAPASNDFLDMCAHQMKSPSRLIAIDLESKHRHHHSAAFHSFVAFLMEFFRTANVSSTHFINIQQNRNKNNLSHFHFDGGFARNVAVCVCALELRWLITLTHTGSREGRKADTDAYLQPILWFL